MVGVMDGVGGWWKTGERKVVSQSILMLERSERGLSALVSGGHSIIRCCVYWGHQTGRDQELSYHAVTNGRFQLLEHRIGGCFKSRQHSSGWLKG